MRFRVLSEAQAELDEAIGWYGRRQVSLGSELLAEIAAVLESIRSHPSSLSRIEGYAGELDLRRVLLKRFPYVVYVLCRDDEVIVTAISHSRRRPLYWMNRLN